MVQLLSATFNDSVSIIIKKDYFNPATYVSHVFDFIPPEGILLLGRSLLEVYMTIKKIYLLYIIFILASGCLKRDPSEVRFSKTNDAVRSNKMLRGEAPLRLKMFFTS